MKFSVLALVLLLFALFGIAAWSQNILVIFLAAMVFGTVIYVDARARK